MTRVEPDGGGGDAVGINPQLLQSMINTMDSSAGDALNLVNGYISQLSRVGLDTSRLNRAVQDLTWAQDQVPMLDRRQSLAQTMAQQNPGLGPMVPAGAGSLGFSTNAAAQQAGQRDAKSFQDGNLSIQQLYAKMAANQGDAAYCTALIKALGADGVRELEQDAPYNPNDPSGQANRSVLAQVVAAAMWHGVTFAEPGYEKGMDGAVGVEDPQMLAPLLSDATFPPQVLSDLGIACMAPGEYQYADLAWKAIAEDPQAASLFITQNAPTIRYWVSQGSDPHRGMPPFSGTDFYNIIQAGTLGEQSVDPQAGAQATQKLVLAYQDDSSAHAPAQIEALYGQIIQAYWPDLIYSVTSPVPPEQTQKGLQSPNGLTLTAQQWSGFVQEAMRDPHTGATLLTAAHTQGNQFMTLSTQQQGSLGGQSAFAGGLVDGYFDAQAQQVYVDKVKEGEDANSWKDSLIEQIGNVVDVGVDVVADPGAAAKTILVAAAKDVAGVATKNIFTDALTSDPQNITPPQYETWQDAYVKLAVEGYNNAAKNDSFPVSTVRQYSVGAGNFIYLKGPDKGQIMPVNEMDPQQLAAFNAWLQDAQVFAWQRHGGVGDEQQLGYGEWITPGQELPNYGGGG
jgi:hypothetical protein